MKRPSIKEVAVELRHINENVECDLLEPDGGWCDVRLQVYEDGGWAVRYGLSDYDQDHHGCWGVSSVPGVQGGVVKRFNSIGTARELIEQVEDAYAQSQV